MNLKDINFCSFQWDLNQWPPACEAGSWTKRPPRCAGRLVSHPPRTKEVADSNPTERSGKLWVSSLSRYSISFNIQQAPEPGQRVARNHTHPLWIGHSRLTHEHIFTQLSPYCLLDHPWLNTSLDAHPWPLSGPVYTSHTPWKPTYLPTSHPSKI